MMGGYTIVSTGFKGKFLQFLLLLFLFLFFEIIFYSMFFV